MQVDSLRVEVNGGRPVARGEGLVALILEVDGFLRHDGFGTESGVRLQRTRVVFAEGEIGGFLQQVRNSQRRLMLVTGL